MGKESEIGSSSQQWGNRKRVSVDVVPLNSYPLFCSIKIVHLLKIQVIEKTNCTTTVRWWDTPTPLLSRTRLEEAEVSAAGTWVIALRERRRMMSLIGCHGSYPSRQASCRLQCPMTIISGSRKLGLRNWPRYYVALVFMSFFTLWLRLPYPTPQCTFPPPHPHVPSPHRLYRRD